LLKCQACKMIVPGHHFYIKHHALLYLPEGDVSQDLGDTLPVC